MKKLLVLISFVFMISVANAQKFGFVDTEKILSQMDEYKKAQSEINRVSVKYQKEIEGMVYERDSLKAALEEERILLTEEMIQKRLIEIKGKDNKIKDKQRNVFGPNGLIFLKRQELIRPVQEIVFEAIKVVAQREKLQVVFDKAGDLTVIYATKTHDYTDYVLEELGLKEEKAKEEK